MEDERIIICKKPGIKNCVRISKVSDIPLFLKDVVKIEDDVLVLDCLEGKEVCPLGSVIAFESLENNKMNVWNKANWCETTKEVDGVFYELPNPVVAFRVTDTIPQSIALSLKDKLSVLESGEFQLDCGWGIVKCAPYNGYLVIYGKKEDGLDVNFLTKGTPSFSQYYVLDNNNEMVESLEEYDFKFQKKFTKKR